MATVSECAKLIKEYYAKDGNGAGGNLHTVLDDNNWDDGSIRYCVERAIARLDGDGIILGIKLLRLSKTQRRKLKYQPAP